MALSYLRPAGYSERSALAQHRRFVGAPRSRRPRGPRIAAVLLLTVAILLGALAVVLLRSSAALRQDSVALARVQMPLGGARIEQVTVTGPRANLIPVRVSGDRIFPTVRIPSHERLTVRVSVVRPGWLAWLSGRRKRLELSILTPSAHPRASFQTLRAHEPLRVAFTQPVQMVAYGPPGRLVRHILASPQASVVIAHQGGAGTVMVAGAPRAWESAQAVSVSWFPAGAATTAVANPAPGGAIGAHTRIQLTFSKPVRSVLGNRLPPVTPAGSGSWRALGAHTLQFVPNAYGYGLGAHVTVALPGAVRLLGGRAGTATIGSWSVPAGSTTRLQQLLSQLGYLPFDVHYAGAPVAGTIAAQEHAAIHTPAGSFSWAYPNVPSQLRALWAPGQYGVMTRGAVMMFENDHGMTADGVAGPAVWKALLTAADQNQRSSFGYTFVMVSEGSPETESTWHSGHTVASGLVNTGIPAAPTATGVYPVFEHLPVTTMSGVNPDGTPYHDPGIRWVSYFNGGDALHEFPRAGYGYPQSLGCVEMPMAEAAAVYPYTPIGALVDVS
jgi:peptidoglycan hydrolase-like protein with peptidoglycan-binding domain